MLDTPAHDSESAVQVAAAALTAVVLLVNIFLQREDLALLTIPKQGIRRTSSSHWRLYYYSTFGENLLFDLVTAP